jgi:hypothetical protein
MFINSMRRSNAKYAYCEFGINVNQKIAFKFLIEKDLYNTLFSKEKNVTKIDVSLTINKRKDFSIVQPLLIVLWHAIDTPHIASVSD